MFNLCFAEMLFEERFYYTLACHILPSCTTFTNSLLTVIIEIALHGLENKAKLI